MRISAVHRDRVEGLSPDTITSLTLPTGLSAGRVAVGDWVLADGAVLRRVLDRQSLLTRRAAGKADEEQLIAANLGRLAIVTACAPEFNVARLERYLTLAHAGGVAPAILLTKADTTDPTPYVEAATQVARSVPVIALNAKSPQATEQLFPWCGPGQTLGLVGSSGVGKSTLASALTGIKQATGEIRTSDGRGRHTTSSRSLIRTLVGGWLIDTPGMRELRLGDAAEALADTFDDIQELALQCRFTDCGHDSEPGCAIRAALDAGQIDPARLANWRKLQDEEAQRVATPQETRARNRAFGKAVKSALAAKRRKGGK
ncbi:MAG: ribosome small subunit-dependent GTPase A [Cereibacter sphaeroides]|uniref:Small ribosomal subunit biogenesis GTPase RsgA n=1 Tax=Cereibacter sphaeroides TaxID=1063 RepID=A0A2W5SK37_CERSP|nr:MAG: ribosome small subunit-dependent GTPase A [Cereibacter sphaeroides]